MSCAGITTTSVEIMLSNVNGICGCAPCDTEEIDNTIPPAIGIMTVYYGRNASTSLTETQILALTPSGQLSFANTYTFVVGAGTYPYVAYPVSFGLPSSIIDPLTGLDFDMQNPVTVNVLAEPYYVFRATNQLGGNVSAKFNP